MLRPVRGAVQSQNRHTGPPLTQNGVQGISPKLRSRQPFALSLSKGAIPSSQNAGSVSRQAQHKRPRQHAPAS